MLLTKYQQYQWGRNLGYQKTFHDNDSKETLTLVLRSNVLGALALNMCSNVCTTIEQNSMLIVAKKHKLLVEVYIYIEVGFMVTCVTMDRSEISKEKYSSHNTLTQFRTYPVPT